MSYEDRIKELERTRGEIIRFTNELDEKLRIKEMDGIEYHVVLNEKLGGKSKEEIINYIDQKMLLEKKKLQDRRQNEKRKTTITISAAAIILIIMAIIGIIYTNPEALTGYTAATKETQEIIEYDRVFEHNTETQLNITNITSLKISGELEGTGAKIKLRINDIEYLIADIARPGEEQSLITGLAIGEEPSPEYTLSTDKNEYAIGEIIYISLTPEAENKSLYISYKEETHRLEDNTYLASQPGEHQAIALIVLPDDILRLETNFTVINESINNTINKTTNTTLNESINETTNQTTNETETNVSEHSQANETTNITTNTTQEKYTFENICVDTCNLIETSYPILIIEPEENSTLTITEITVVQNKKNKAPKQTRTIPDITITTAQTASLNLDEYFSDPDEDLVAYDINEIPEISTEITQETLTISSETPGTYTAYIYATDGDKLVTSNTFQITIIETNATINQTINITLPPNETINISQPTNITTNIIPPTLIDPCSHPNPNMRPMECIEGKEEKYFVLESVFLKNNKRSNSARITSLGNMIIKGQLFENSTISPGVNDFKVTDRNTDYEYVPVAWIDSNTGNLYLRGELYEEDFFLSPTPNAFVVQNKRNVNLAYIDRRTGDLHIKGNLIQNRESIE